jgi:hypothetical protein
MNKESVNYSIDEFFGMLFHIRASLCLLGYNRSGVSAESQCNALFDAERKISFVLDGLIKGSQGESMAIFDIRIPKTDTPKNALEFGIASQQYIKKTRKVFSESWQQSEVDKRKNYQY